MHVDVGALAPQGAQFGATPLVTGIVISLDPTGYVTVRLEHPISGQDVLSVSVDRVTRIG